MTPKHQYMKHENKPDSHESKMRTWGGGGGRSTNFIN